MRLVITESIEKKARKLGITFNDVYVFIQSHCANSSCLLEELCSPIPGTIAYKGYMSGVHRIVVFLVINNGIIYPAYIGDKNDPIAKNITTDVVRRNASKWEEEVKSDLRNHRIKIRHF